MGKVTKHKGKGDEIPKFMATELLEQKAQADLDRQNYRRAKEWLKELCNRNKPHYLPRLIECYNGLAKQMLEKGQTADAKTIFAQIRLLAGDKVDPGAEAQLAIRSEDYLTAAAVLSRQRSGGQKPRNAEDGRLMADALVIAFEDVPRFPEEQPQLYGELTAVRRALEYVSAGRFTDALGELKRIPLQSVFADWRLFIKGMCAFYTGENSKAREAFQRLRGESLLVRAARPFILILEQSTRWASPDEAKEPLLVQVCQILNRPDMASVLPHAEYLWQLKRYADSYAHVAQALKGFPSEEPGLVHTLSLFYFNAIFHMDPRQAEKYLKGIDFVVSKKNINATYVLFFTRMRNLYFDDEPDVADRDYLEMWQDFLISSEQIHGVNNNLRALVNAHLGERFAKEEESSDPYHFLFERKKRRHGARNFRLAEDAYIKSLQFNGQDKDTHLSLLRLYEAAGDNGKRNKKLDDISKLFPDDKDSLAKNGAFCIERNAFIKGIEFLKKAAALDPIDRNNRESLILAYMKASLHYAKEGNTWRYREFMGYAMERGEPGLGNMNMGLPYLQTRLAIMEWIAGCAEEGNRRWADVSGKSTGDCRILYFASLIGRIYGVREPYLSQLQNLIKPIFQDPTPAIAGTLIDVLQYVKRIEANKQWFDEEFHRLTKFAGEAANKACTPQEAEKIVRYALEQKRDGQKLVERYVRKILAQDPRHPLFLYFKYLSERSFHYCPVEENDWDVLNDILAIAVERNERLLINLLNKELRKIDDVLSMGPPFDDYDDDDDDDDKDDDDDGDDMRFPIDFNKIMAEMVKEMEGRKGEKKSSPRQKKTSPADNRQASLFDDLDLD